MTAIESLKQIILNECEEDHVGLWSVVRDAAEALPKRSEKAIRDIVLKLLHELLVAQDIKAGFPTDDGDFLPVDGPPEVIVAKIRADWPVGHSPNIGEGLWLTKAHEPNPLSDLVEAVKRDKDAGNYLPKINPRKYGFDTEDEYWKRVRELADIPKLKKT